MLTLSTCACQYSSCAVRACVLLMREKNVGFVRCSADALMPKAWATVSWTLCRTSLSGGTHVRAHALTHVPAHTEHTHRPCTATHVCETRVHTHTCLHIQCPPRTCAHRGRTGTGPRATCAHVREGGGPRVRTTRDAAPAQQDGLLFHFQTTGWCLHVGSTSSRVPPSGRAPTGGTADFSGDPPELISASGGVTLTPATLTELLLGRQRPPVRHPPARPEARALSSSQPVARKHRLRALCFLHLCSPSGREVV